MAVSSKTDVELSGELEQIAAAAAERLRALTVGDVEPDADLGRRWVRRRAARSPLACRWPRLRTPSRSARGGRARSWARSFCDAWSTPHAASATPSMSTSRRSFAPGGLASRIATWRLQRRWRMARCARSSPARTRPAASTPRRRRARAGRGSGSSRQTGMGWSMLWAIKRDPPTRQARDRGPRSLSTVAALTAAGARRGSLRRGELTARSRDAD